MERLVPRRMGWRVDQTYQSGPPVSVTFAGSPNNYLPDGVMRPNQILPDAAGAAERLGHRAEPISHSALKTGTSVSTRSRIRRHLLLVRSGGTRSRVPGLRWTQVSLSKEFRITERARFENPLGYQ